ncbi:MAG TPA: hypothetical protein VGO08_04800, partial [Burkholderiales bacterium]|nr:hypothetical protein [Burkholderiales bacterium]
AQVQLFDRVIELLHGEIGKLKGERRKSNKSFRMRSADLGELLILNPDHLSRAITVKAVPDRVDAQGFHINALRIHRRKAVSRHIEFGRRYLASHESHGFRYDAVRMHVDRFHAPPVHNHLTSPAVHPCLQLGLLPLHRTTCECDTRNSTDCIFYELPACAHHPSFGLVTAPAFASFLTTLPHRYSILSSFAAVPPSMAMRSSSLNPGVFKM